MDFRMLLFTVLLFTTVELCGCFLIPDRVRPTILLKPLELGFRFQRYGFLGNSEELYEE